MSVANIARIIARCERVLFPTKPLETRPDAKSTVCEDADPVEAMPDGRGLPIQGDPFTGFNSPPGRF
jgi:hypothetical protein